MIEDRSSRPPVVVRLRNFVGDVVLGLPALQLLAQHGHPLQLIGKGWAPSLLEAQGWPVHVRPAKTRARVAQLRGLRRAARAQHPGFEHGLNALVLPWSFSSALEMRLAGLLAIGYRHEARGFLLRRSLPMPPPGHALLNYWDLACTFLDLPPQAPPREIGMRVSPAQRAAAQALLDAQGVTGPYLLVCPFASGNFATLDKTWPAFADFVALATARGHRVLVCPGPGEEAAAASLYPSALSLPDVKLGVYAALLQQAALVVSNDTGPAHVAAAVGARVLSVLGPTDPDRWAPWGAQVDVLRLHPAWPSPQQALQRAEALLGGAAASGGAWPFCFPDAAVAS